MEFTSFCGATNNIQHIYILGCDKCFDEKCSSLSHFKQGINRKVLPENVAVEQKSKGIGRGEHEIS